MTEAPLSGALGGLKVIEPSDLPRYRSAVETGRQIGFSYYFPYLLSRNRPNRSSVLLAEDDGSFCVYLLRHRESNPRLELLVAPTPMNALVLDRCLERANDFNGDSSARVLRIDARDVDAISSLTHLRIRERKAQYLYAPAAFAEIGGRKFRTLRRNVTAVAALPELEVQAYSAGKHAEACHDLLRRWLEQHRAVHDTAGGAGTTRRVIDMAGSLPVDVLHGEVILLDGKLAGFAFGGEIRPGVGCFFEAKCDSSIPGISYFQRYSFLSKLTDFELVNDGSDVGRSGLRQLKTSLRPAEMHSEYRATQRPLSRPGRSSASAL